MNLFFSGPGVSTKVRSFSSSSEVKEEEARKTGFRRSLEELSLPRTRMASSAGSSHSSYAQQQVKLAGCAPHCSEGRGICVQGTCFCRSPFRGPDCRLRRDLQDVGTTGGGGLFDQRTPFSSWTPSVQELQAGVAATWEWP